MADTKKVITTVREVSGLLLSDDATVFANDNGQLVQVPLSSLGFEGASVDIETAGDEDVDDLLDALGVPGTTP